MNSGKYLPYRFPDIGPRRFAIRPRLFSIAPTVVITCAQSDYTGKAVLNFTATFSEYVTGFVVGDITVGNGSAGNFATSDNFVFTFDVTPTSSLVTVDIGAGVCADLGGNPNTAATQYTITAQTLSMTVTTTGAQTLTLDNLTVDTGKTVKIFWGDGSDTTYTTGAGSRTHNYAGAGTWSVSITETQNITSILFQDAKITTLSISSTNLMPTGLTALNLYNLSGLTWTVGASAPMPTGLTYFQLLNLPGLTWTVGASAPMPTGLATLYLNNLPGLTWTVGASAPMPTGLPYLHLNNLPGLTWTVGASAPVPTGLTTLQLLNLSGLTWTIDGTYAWPTGATDVVVTACPSVTVSVWTNNAVRTVQFTNAWSQANVDACLLAFLNNKANFTWATPALDLLGGSNAAPSGTYQTASPPTTGKEYAYDLVNGSYTPAGPEWTVTTA